MQLVKNNIFVKTSTNTIKTTLFIKLKYVSASMKPKKYVLKQNNTSKYVFICIIKFKTSLWKT